MTGAEGALAGRMLIVAGAALAGVASMLLYKVASPQRRLEQLAAATSARWDWIEHDGSFRDAWPLIRRDLGLALARVRLSLGPSLLAGLPVLLGAYLMEDALSAVRVLPLGPAWLRSGWSAFFLAAALAALAVKLLLRIK